MPLSDNSESGDDATESKPHPAAPTSHSAARVSVQSSSAVQRVKLSNASALLSRKLDGQKPQQAASQPPSASSLFQKLKVQESSQPSTAKSADEGPLTAIRPNQASLESNIESGLEPVPAALLSIEYAANSSSRQKHVPSPLKLQPEVRA
jgi:hypothetical protein